MKSERVRRIEQRLTEHADWIARMYAPGAKVTIIVRHPDEPDGYMITTADDLAGIMDVIDRVKWGPGELQHKGGEING